MTCSGQFGFSFDVNECLLDPFCTVTFIMEDIA